MFKSNHAARFLTDKSNKHKNSQLSYLIRLTPQLPPQTNKTTATKKKFTENADLHKEQLELLTDNREVTVKRDIGEVLEEKNDRNILGQLKVIEEKNLLEQKSLLKS